MRCKLLGRLATALALVLFPVGAVPALAEDTPQRGGVLVFADSAEPPTLDCHQANTFAVVDLVAPLYSLLIRYDLDHPGRYEPDLAKSWEASADGLTHTFRLHDNIRFHDGSPLTSADVKASFDRLRDPPQGIISTHQEFFHGIAAVETPDPATVVFRLREVDAGFMAAIASPWACIYSAQRLKAEPHYPERSVMGSGAFMLDEYVAGSHFSGKRFDGYFLKDRPYLDGYRAVFVSGPALINGIAGGQLMGEFRSLSPSERDRIVAARGDGVRVYQNRNWVQTLQVVVNTTRKPFDDVRVRRALSLGIDRWGSAESMSKISFFGPVSGFLPPGSEWAIPKEELEKVPGFGRDIAAARAEARRLLQEAGVPNLSFKLTNRAQVTPYTPAGVFLIDQWRQIGVTVEHQLLQTPPWQAARDSTNFDLLLQISSEHDADPAIWLGQYQSPSKAPENYSRSSDPVIDDLFAKQRHSLDRAQRIETVHQLERHMLQQQYFMPVFWTERLITLDSRVHGWRMSWSHFLGQDLRDVWLAH